MNQLISNTRKDGFKEEEVKDMKSTYITNYFYRLETNAAQAAALAVNEVLHNNWRRALTVNDEMSNLTRADLNRVFNKYVNHISWVYMGDPAKVNPAFVWCCCKAEVANAGIKSGEEELVRFVFIQSTDSAFNRRINETKSRHADALATDGGAFQHFDTEFTNDQFE